MLAFALALSCAHAGEECSSSADDVCLLQLKSNTDSLMDAEGNPAATGDLGRGKCVTLSGGEPKHYLYEGEGNDCKFKCKRIDGDLTDNCYGYAVTERIDYGWTIGDGGDCIIYLEDIQGGGEEWGDAHCIRTRAPPVDLGSDLGDGKCVTLSGEDPQHKYIEGKYADKCAGECIAEATCYGYSYSGDGFDPMGQMHGSGRVPGNCLLWLEPIKGGGAEWGKGHCMRIRDNPEEVHGGKKDKKEGGRERKKKRRRNREGRRNKEGKRRKEGKKNKEGKKKKKGQDSKQ